jgi:cyclase
MLKTRIIPTLLWKNMGLAKGISFDSWRRVGTVLPQIKIYNSRDVDEMILVDIDAYREKRKPDLAEVEELTAECSVPITIGGGINSLQDFRDLLIAGADKVSLNSSIFDDISIVGAAASRFGSQCVVVSIDAKKNPDKGSYECWKASGTENTGIDVVEWAQKVEKQGAGEILLTSIENDGTMNGYDLDLIKLVTEAVSIPVIASGGAGSADDMVRAISDSGASSVAASSMFLFTEVTPLECRNYLGEHGIAVRKTN